MSNDFLQKMAGLVAVKFMVNIVVWSGLSMLEVCCNVDFVSLLAVEGNFLAVSRVLLRTLDECKCFDAWRKWSCRVVYVWPRTISDTIVSMFIWFCNLEWMIYRDTLIWCDLLKLKIYQVEGTVLVSVRIKSTKKHIPLKKMMDHVQSCQYCLSNIARVKYSIVTSHLRLHLLLLSW